MDDSNFQSDAFFFSFILARLLFSTQIPLVHLNLYSFFFSRVIWIYKQNKSSYAEHLNEHLSRCCFRHKIMRNGKLSRFYVEFFIINLTTLNKFTKSIQHFRSLFCNWHFRRLPLLVKHLKNTSLIAHKKMSSIFFYFQFFLGMDGKEFFFIMPFNRCWFDLLANRKLKFIKLWMIRFYF